MSSQRCTKHNCDLECMAGRNAHASNWYCPECDKEAVVHEQKPKNIKIIEGTAEYIEEVLEEETFYELDSLQYIYNSRIYNDDGITVSSNHKHAFYCAVLRKM